MPNRVGDGAAGVVGARLPRARFARGLGALYTGAGIYNRRTAIARSINADTWHAVEPVFLLSTRRSHPEVPRQEELRFQKNKDAYNLRSSSSLQDNSDCARTSRTAMP